MPSFAAQTLGILNSGLERLVLLAGEFGADPTPPPATIKLVNADRLVSTPRPFERAFADPFGFRERVKFSGENPGRCHVGVQELLGPLKFSGTLTEVLVHHVLSREV